MAYEWVHLTRCVQVKDHTGRTHRLADYQGKNVVLWFYPKADTPG